MGSIKVLHIQEATGRYCSLRVKNKGFWKRTKKNPEKRDLTLIQKYLASSLCLTKPVTLSVVQMFPWPCSGQLWFGFFFMWAGYYNWKNSLFFFFLPNPGISVSQKFMSYIRNRQLNRCSYGYQRGKGRGRGLN